MIDLRSDTVTRPTPAMRQAMARAEVGDDVYGEDPTVNRLQSRAAEIMGKPAALLVPSGTMGNLVSLLAHCGRGQEVIVGDQAHIVHYEAGNASALGGLVYRTVPTRIDGTLNLDAVCAAVGRPAGDAHFAPPGVVCLENTHNRMGGVIVPPAHLAEVAALAASCGLPVHLDGARLFNAAVSSGLPVRAWTDHATTVQFCLSKGLGAPIGSIVAGPRDVIDRAWRVRKMVGGGMRQAGIIAAAGIVALGTMVDRLHEDHENAALVAAVLAQVQGVTIDVGRVQTNIVVFEPPDQWEPRQFIQAAADAGVLLTAFGGRRVRAMTHAGVSVGDCERAAVILAALLRRGG